MRSEFWRDKPYGSGQQDQPKQAEGRDSEAKGIVPCLVTEQPHTQPETEAAAQCADTQQRPFPDSPLLLLRQPLISPAEYKAGQVDNYQPEQYNFPKEKSA